MAAERAITNMLILIADDDRDSTDTLADLIQLEFGCRVVTAYNGEDALTLALAGRPDVLILDLKMPGLPGLEVAAEVTYHSNFPARPLILAVTGRNDLARDLAAIDVRFDRAFAKPLDHATLFATLRAHMRGDTALKPAVDYRFFDTFTQAARDAMPLLAARRQQLSFDSEGSELTLRGDETGTRSALYRLMCGALELMGSGFVMFTAKADAGAGAGARRHTLTVNLAGSGRLESPEHMAGVLKRLGLTADAAAPEPTGARAVVQAFGLCPNTGGRVTFTCQTGQNILLRLTLDVQPIESAPPPFANGATAWLIDRREIAPAVLERRLQRLGWCVRRFASVTEACRHLSAPGTENEPDLLLVSDEPPGTRSSVLALRHRVPARTRCVLLVGAGPSMPRQRSGAESYDIHTEPLSPADLAQATRLAADPAIEVATDLAASLATHPANDGASPQPALPDGRLWHGLQGRRKVLIVDDHEINRIVATGLLRALGYEVASVADGLDAIEYCKQSPPDAVLMDVNMRVLDGIDATRRMLELQRLGRMAPFAIVAATADDTPQTRARCFDAGMRGYLCKPLCLEVMRDELRHVGVPAVGATKYPQRAELVPSPTAEAP